MTIFAIILSIIASIFLVIIIIGFDLFLESNVYRINEWIFRGGSFALAIVGVFVIFFAAHWYCNNTESGKRAMKSQEINFNNNIEREVKVYDINGEVVESYRGRFDVSYTDERIMFDDEQGNRHIIYFKTGMVTVNDVTEVQNDDTMD